jgi:hypothetical protein
MLTGTEVDDPAMRAREPPGEFDGEHCRGPGVDLVMPVERFTGQRVHIVMRRMGSIVDQDVDRAERGFGGIEYCGCAVRQGEIGLDCLRPDPKLAQLAQQLIRLAQSRAVLLAIVG